jgi:hypothetical protein
LNGIKSLKIKMRLIYEISMTGGTYLTSGTHLTSGTNFRINWTKIKINDVKRPSPRKEKGQMLGLAHLAD